MFTALASALHLLQEPQHNPVALPWHTVALACPVTTHLHGAGPPCRSGHLSWGLRPDVVK